MSRLYYRYQSNIRFVSIALFIASIGILGKTLQIQTFQAAEYRNQTLTAGITERDVTGFRGNIYDQNNQPLAETIKTYTFWANTNKTVDKDRIINLFSKIFNKSEEYYRNLLSLDKNYIMLARGMFQDNSKPILNEIKDIKGLYYDVKATRYYPYRNLASQVVGYLDQDYKGQFGIERQFDPLLKGKTSSLVYKRSANGTIRKAINNPKLFAINGSDIYLTLDIDIQAILIEALKQGLKRSGAKNANGVIINPFTGDILAMASVPDFDPNIYWEFDPSTFSNHTISSAYEPGSTYKIISLAAAFESGNFKPNDSFYCENGAYQIIPSKIIHDHEPHNNLTLSEIFIYSSNIGLSKMVDKLGAQHIYDFSRKFGFGIRSGVPLPGETPGILRKFSEWTRLSGPSVSMGQEISINTLQLALAYSAVANGGYLPKPRMIRKISGKDYIKRDYSPKPIRQVMSKQTADILLNLMEDVVNKGTATKARIPGFRVGGKTGTAEKFIGESYSKREFISSFAAIFPINNPQYVCVVSVDSPDYYRGKHWGNETAAPIVKDIFERLIIKNEDFIPYNPMPDYQLVEKKSLDSTQVYKLLTNNNIIYKNKTVPDFKGMTLKQSIKKAKVIGLEILPIGTSGRVVWQSASPGQLVENISKCTIKLESM